MNNDIHLAEKEDRRGSRIASVAFLVVATILSASLFGLFAFLETDAALGTVQDVRDHYVCDVDAYDLVLPSVGSVSEIYTSDGVLLDKPSYRNTQPVEFDDIPETVIQALLAAEDSNFYEHEGIDFLAIVRATVANLQGGNIQGGSTITQQTVKRNFLSAEHTLERKVCEAVLAAELESLYSKDEILESYLNTVFFGQNAYGIKAAVQEYFGKALKDVTIAEAAAIVTPLRSPSKYDLRNEPQAVLRARNDTIAQMESNGFITADEAQIARSEPLAPIEPTDSEQLAPAVVIAAREELLRSPAYGLGDTFSARTQALFGCPAADAQCEGGGGLKIGLTVDYRLQEEANRILRAWFQRPDGPTGAIAMVDNDTGAIKVMASGLDFGDDYDSGERPYDLATKGRRQAGSSFKPLALIAALEQGTTNGRPITLGSHFDGNGPKLFDCGYPCSGASNFWTVANAGADQGLVDLATGTVRSINTVYAQLAINVGPEQISDAAHKLGIESPLNPVPSIALGSQSVSPLEMASAYSTIANLGERVDSHLIETIHDEHGNLIYQHESTKEQVVDASLARAVVDTLERVPRAGGTASEADIGRPQGGKTGTTQQYRDAWFVGFIPQYTTSVWVGHADSQVAMENFTVWDDLNQKPRYYSRAFGGRLAAPIWKQFMEFATDGLPIEDFPPLDDAARRYFKRPTTKVPDLAGLPLAKAKRAVADAGLRVGLVEEASSEPIETILDQVPGSGTVVEQGSTVTIEVSSGETPVMPDLTGADRTSIAGEIEDFNQKTNLDVRHRIKDRETSNEEEIDKVVGQTPKPGDPVSSGQEFVIIVGVAPD